MNSAKQKRSFTGEITIYNVLQYVYKNWIYAAMSFLLFFAVGLGFGDTRGITYQATANIRIGLEDRGDIKYRLAIINSFFRQLEAQARKMEPPLYPDIRYGAGRITLQEVLLTGNDKDKVVEDMMSLLSNVGKRMKGLETGLFRTLKISDTKGKKVVFAVEGISVTSQHKGRSAAYKAVVLGIVGLALGWVFAGFVQALRKEKKIPKT